VIDGCRYGQLYKLIEDAEEGVSQEEGAAMRQSFEGDAFALDQLLVYMRQVPLLPSPHPPPTPAAADARQVGKLGGIQGVMNRLPAAMKPSNMPQQQQQHSPLGDANLLRVSQARVHCWHPPPLSCCC